MSRIKVFIISILGIILLVGGFIMFRGVINNKQVYETDLYTYLPSDISSVVQINKEKDLNYLLPYTDSLSQVITEIKSSINYPIIIAQYKQYNYLVIKTTSSQEIDIKNILNQNLYPSFPPKEIKYKDATLFIYTTPNNNFFICTFYKNIFIGGFNIELFQKYIDNNVNSIGGIGHSPLGVDILSSIKTQYKGNLFLNNSSSLSVFNIDFDANKIDMNGYNTQPEKDNWVCSDKIDTLKIDYSIFPDSIIGYKVEMDNPIIVNDTMKCLFSAPSYSFYMHEEEYPVYALKHIGDKFNVYNLLNQLEKKYINSQFKINDFYSGYRIYTTSSQIGKNIFGVDNPFYLLFYRDYFIFSENKSALTNYLDNNGKFDSKNRLQTNQKEQPLRSLIYSVNLNKWHPDFFNPNNIITNNKSNNVYMTTIMANKKKTYKIFINN